MREELRLAQATAETLRVEKEAAKRTAAEAGTETEGVREALAVAEAKVRVAEGKVEQLGQRVDALTETAATKETEYTAALEQARLKATAAQRTFEERLKAVEAEKQEALAAAAKGLREEQERAAKEKTGLEAKLSSAQTAVSGAEAKLATETYRANEAERKLAVPTDQAREIAELKRKLALLEKANKTLEARAKKARQEHTKKEIADAFPKQLGEFLKKKIEQEPAVDLQVQQPVTRGVRRELFFSADDRRGKKPLRKVANGSFSDMTPFDENDAHMNGHGGASSSNGSGFFN